MKLPRNEESGRQAATLLKITSDHDQLDVTTMYSVETIRLCLDVFDAGGTLNGRDSSGGYDLLRLMVEVIIAGLARCSPRRYESSYPTRAAAMLPHHPRR